MFEILYARCSVSSAIRCTQGNQDIQSIYKVTQKNGKFWKPQQKLKKSKEKNYWQKLNHYNLPF